MRPLLKMRFVMCLLLAGLTISTASANNATLTYDPAGNVATRTTQLGTTIYTYDQLNRLTAESGPAGNFTYHYDPNGVRLSDSNNTYSYSSTSNRLASRNGVAVVTDAAGNISNDGRGNTYVYNQSGQLAQVLRGSILIATYTYDYRGLRTRKVTTSAAPQKAQVVRYVYDEAGHLFEELNAVGAPIRTYIWRDDTPVAQIDHIPTRKIIYFDVDHLNTPRAATNQSGAVVWTWESDAFGAIQPNQNPSGLGVEIVNLRFPGQYYDQETGLYYNMHRYYDPTMGQYTQPDIIGLRGASFSTYQYVKSNPLKYSDPWGLLDRLVFNGTTLTGYDDMAVEFRVSAVSGPYGDGNLPEGTYNGSNLRIRRDNTAMMCSANPGWSLDLDPSFPTDRTLLRIHPDGNVPGTEGCIGVSCTGSDQQKVYNSLHNYFNLPGINSIPVIVSYPK